MPHLCVFACSGKYTGYGPWFRLRIKVGWRSWLEVELRRIKGFIRNKRGNGELELKGRSVHWVTGDKRVWDWSRFVCG